MKRNGILNTKLISEIASIGHTQYFVIGDAGLPVPKGVRVIDLSLKKGIPGFIQVLEAVNEELVSESYIMAEEIKKVNRELDETVHELLPGLPALYIPHKSFKKLTEEAKVIIRTGESSSYANIILIAGVNF